MNSPETEPISLALCGDVMTGRGIDQILQHPSDPALHEDYVRDAWEYVGLAVHANGPIPFPVDYNYAWGDALAELHRADARIVNLETSITRSDDYWSGKGIHYRMHPQNIGCLTAARIDCCGLANNHVLDWGYAGLEETLRTLDNVRTARAGAGRSADEASSPAVIDIANKGRVLITAIGFASSGIPSAWAATPTKAGINFEKDISLQTAERVAQDLLRITRPNDVTIVSIHWGGNWGHEISEAKIAFAHRLVDEGIDVVHGHSSHHPKAIEIRRGRLILYGCGDFVNDYEGISGHEEYRDDLAVLYQIRIVPQPRRLVEVRLVPFQLKQLRLNRATASDARWLCGQLHGQCMRFGASIGLQSGHSMIVEALPNVQM